VFGTTDKAKGVREQKLHEVFRSFLMGRVTGEFDHGEYIENFFFRELRPNRDYSEGAEQLGDLAGIEISVRELGDSSATFSYADLRQARQAALKEVHNKLDNLNGREGESDRLCLVCGSTTYNPKEGIVHNSDCIIRWLRKQLKPKGGEE